MEISSFFLFIKFRRNTSKPFNKIGIDLLNKM